MRNARKKDKGLILPRRPIRLLILVMMSIATIESSRAENKEARGVWVTRWDFSSPQDIDSIMNNARAAGFNQVYFQVRGVADAYYQSSLEPWAAPLAGKLGKNPGWDPLGHAIQAAHNKNLQLHAWINVCTGWKGKKRPGASSPIHIMRSHPEWRVQDKQGQPSPVSDSQYTFLNPAHPGFQKHIEAVITEIASFYEVDGIHLDYARYPSRKTSYDPLNRKRFRIAKRSNLDLDHAAWQRHELTSLIQRIKTKVIQVRPQATISAAVTGIYVDRWGWGDVIQGKIDFHQDSQRWLQEQTVDVVIPMIYWKPAAKRGMRTDFETLVKDFSKIKGAALLVGINVEAGTFSHLQQEIQITRKYGVQGVVLFAYQALKHRNWFSKLKQSVFQNPSHPPSAHLQNDPHRLALNLKILGWILADSASKHIERLGRFWSRAL